MFLRVFQAVDLVNDIRVPNPVEILFAAAVVEANMDLVSASGNGFVVQGLVDVADEVDEVHKRF